MTQLCEEVVKWNAHRWIQISVIIVDWPHLLMITPPPWGGFIQSGSSICPPPLYPNTLGWPHVSILWPHELQLCCSWGLGHNVDLLLCVWCTEVGSETLEVYYLSNSGSSLVCWPPYYSLHRVCRPCWHISFRKRPLKVNHISVMTVSNPNWWSFHGVSLAIHVVSSGLCGLCPSSKAPGDASVQRLDNSPCNVL